MASRAEADTYFTKRLNSKAWRDAGEADQGAALAQAEREINTLTFTQDPDGQSKDNAIYEQALFLLQMSSYDHERQRMQALGIIGGSVGKANEYSSAEIIRQKMSGVFICPSALSFLNNYIIKGKTRAGCLI